MALPIDPADGRINTHPGNAFGAQGTFDGGAFVRIYPHTGWDWLLFSSSPQPVYSRADGVVVGSDYLPASAGNFVRIRSNTGSVWRGYAHLSRRDVKVGQSVKAGQQIGMTGSTGSYGKAPVGHHLHEMAWTSEAACLANAQPRQRYKGESVAAWAAAVGYIDPNTTRDQTGADASSPGAGGSPTLPDIIERFAMLPFQRVRATQKNDSAYLFYRTSKGGWSRIKLSGTQNNVIAKLEKAKAGEAVPVTDAELGTLDRLLTSLA